MIRVTIKVECGDSLEVTDTREIEFESRIEALGRNDLEIGRVAATSLQDWVDTFQRQIR